MKDQDKLLKLIDAIFEWAGRPTKDGAKNLRDLVDSLDPRNSYSFLVLTEAQSSNQVP